MKKMLDELKKLDNDYKVPENFTKNVMNEIRNIEKQKMQKKKNTKKYVITWMSTAAVILIAVVVSLKSAVGNKANDAMQYNMSPDYSQQANENIMADISATTESLTTNNMSSEILNKCIDEKERLLEEDAISANTAILNLKEILDYNDIKIIEENDDYLIIDTTIEVVNEILKDYLDGFNIIEDGGMVKIWKEV